MAFQFIPFALDDTIANREPDQLVYQIAYQIRKSVVKAGHKIELKIQPGGGVAIALIPDSNFNDPLNH